MMVNTIKSGAGTDADGAQSRASVKRLRQRLENCLVELDRLNLTLAALRVAEAIDSLDQVGVDTHGSS